MIRELRLDCCNLAEATIKGGDCLIQITFTGRAIPLATCEAIAHLIAAAPDMYEALQAFRDWMLEDTRTIELPAADILALHSIAQKVKQALAKAEGGE